LLNNAKTAKKRNYFGSKISSFNFFGIFFYHFPSKK